jgi:hypothetical protein
MSISGVAVSGKNDYNPIYGEIQYDELPELVKRNVMVLMEPAELLKLCMSSKHKGLCNDDSIWMERLQLNCPEYKELGIAVAPHDSKRVWKRCVKMRKHVKNLKGKNRTEAILGAIYSNDRVTLHRLSPTVDEINRKLLLIHAIRAGNLDIAKYLMSSISGSVDLDMDKLLFESGTSNNVDIPKWLLMLKGSDPERVVQLAMFDRAIFESNMDMIKWLDNRYRFTKQEILYVDGNRSIFLTATQNAKPQVGDWVIRRYNITIEDI